MIDRTQSFQTEQRNNMTTRSKTTKTNEERETEDRSLDKESLLRALDDHGPCVIYDFELLRTYFPSKSDAQLKFLVASYEKKGKDLSLKQNYMDRFIEMKNINKWLSVISNCVPFPAKKDDFSRVLLDIFTQFSEYTMSNYYDRENGEDKEDDKDDDAGEDDEDDEGDEDMLDNEEERENSEVNLKGNDTFENRNGEKIDYNVIYSFFNEILNRRFPFKLQEKEAAIALSLMTNVREMVELVRNEDEKAFLQAASWWKPTADNANGTINGQADNPDANGTANNSAANEINPDQPEHYADLPRFRKIRDCLNPLKIPSWILNDNHDLLSSHLT
ncbi:ATP-dependent DNA helicase CHL1-like [Tetranychus urticae]|uniref:ATP-dependent DNA helicase CHL1-like n=1 Tax=Tetranychus urticae TaxID=32264 RepID=UPI00077BB52F|nr:ATP-dependent DNA helicase CHL1-like [Tetranychus urticae]